MLRTWVKRKLAGETPNTRYNAAQREKIIHLMQRAVTPLSLGLFLIGIVWMLLLPYEGFNRRTYISENALLPGQVNVYYGYNDINTAENYRYKLLDVQTKDNMERATWIQTEFQRMGFTSAVQPFNIYNETGVNSYAVYHAPRSDGKEALVLSAPWISRTGDYNTNGIAAMLSVAKLFKRNVYWSKDIILLVTDSGMAGAQAWVDAYHGTGDQAAFSVVMPRSGAIQGVVNLDFPGIQDYESLGLFFEGVNGQLPNLDLINTIVTVNAHTSRVDLTLHEETTFPFQDTSWASYFESLYHMYRMMKYQALNHPSSEAGVYLSYKIDAVTIHGIRGSTRLNSLFGFHKIGILIESTFRSLNNLLEHFHQSFFFYLLLKPGRFVSIGEYMPPVILLTCSLVFQSLALYYITPKSSGTAKIQKSTSTDIPPAYSIRGVHVSFAFFVMVITHLAGLGIFYIMQYQRAGAVVEQEALVVQFMISTCVALMVVTSAIVWLLWQPESPFYDGRILKSFCLAYGGLVVSTVSLLNLSLAVMTALLIVPPYSLARPTRNGLARIAQLLILFLVSPPGLAIVYMTVACQRGTDELGVLLSNLLADYRIVGSWLLLYICIAYWPMNMAMQILIFSNP
ncbi:Gaa1-like protein [Dichotomocladium elegans]|nr:Gaa1-like protein [Dichotomocladium elegans]